MFKLTAHLLILKETSIQMLHHLLHIIFDYDHLWNMKIYKPILLLHPMNGFASYSQ